MSENDVEIQVDEETTSQFGGEPKTLRYAIHFEQLATDQLKAIREAKMTGDEALIHHAVSQLENILETEVKNKIRKQRIDEGKYTETTTIWKARGFMSSDPLNPAITNIPGTDIYDPNFTGTRYELIKDGDPDNPEDWIRVQERGGIHWMSPYQFDDTQTNYDMWISDMVDEFQSQNAAWRGVNRARLLGRIPQRDKEPKPLLIPLPQSPV